MRQRDVYETERQPKYMREREKKRKREREKKRIKNFRVWGGYIVDERFKNDTMQVTLRFIDAQK